MIISIFIQLVNDFVAKNAPNSTRFYKGQGTVAKSVVPQAATSSMMINVWFFSLHFNLFGGTSIKIT